MSPSLSVVSAAEPRPPKPETVAQTVRRLQAEAKALALDHVAELTGGLRDLARLAAEIADGGDAYAIGTRNVARLLVDELESRAETIGAIQARAK